MLCSTWCPGLPYADRGPLTIRCCVQIGASGSSYALYRGEVIYDFVRGLLTELTALLPNAHFHIGGDEVQYQCWRTDPDMTAYLKSRNMSNQALYREFEGRVIGILAELGKAPMFWNSVLDAGVTIPPAGVVHSCKPRLCACPANLQSALSPKPQICTGELAGSLAPAA